MTFYRILFTFLCVLSVRFLLYVYTFIDPFAAAGWRSPQNSQVSNYLTAAYQKLRIFIHHKW